MATNLTVAMEVYSKRYLAGLTPQIAFLSAFSTDFSDELVEEGAKIRGPIVTPAAADSSRACGAATRPAARSNCYGSRSPTPPTCPTGPSSTRRAPINLESRWSALRNQRMQR